MTTEIIPILPVISFSIFGIISLLIIWNIYKKLLKIKYVRSFVDYVAVLEYNMNKAYEMIHKDRILTYSLEATRVKEEEINVISQDFARLVIKLIGPTLYSEFLTLYGNEETFMFVMIEYFNTQYENDEIRKNSLADLSSGEELPEGLTNETKA